MMNTFWVMVVPGIIGVYHMIIFRTFFRGLPDGLEESARIDGRRIWHVVSHRIAHLRPRRGRHCRCLRRSGTGTTGLAPGFHQQDGIVADSSTVLKQILNSNIMTEQMLEATGGNAAAQDMLNRAQTVTTKSLTMATMMVATPPIVAVYPFVQKYFVKGVLIGFAKE